MNTNTEEDKDAYITVTHGILGYFAVHIWWNEEDGGFWEPWNTGIGRYKYKEEAVIEAKAWAEDEGIPYKESKTSN